VISNQNDNLLSTKLTQIKLIKYYEYKLLVKLALYLFYRKIFLKAFFKCARRGMLKIRKGAKGQRHRGTKE